MTATAATDEALMLRFASGEGAAFEDLYRRHELKVWRYLYRSVGNRATADELLQEVWFAVAREAVRYRATARFTTWLYTLAHNRLVDCLRTARHHASLEAVAEDGTTLAERLPADATAGPFEEAQSQEDAAVLITAIGQLPAEQREAFLLQAEGDLSVEEIAAATGTSFETAKSRLRYARVKLKQLLREYA